MRNDWGNIVYPCLPGHEIIDKVIDKGTKVTKFQVGDTVGVGCMIDSCGQCASCREGMEQYCEGPKSWTATYNGPVKPDGSNTYGGYSNNIVVKESFVLRIPDSLDIKAAAPILCAGITTYSPLRHWGVKAGSQVAVAGLGGMGHMAIKIARALRAGVVIVSDDKEAMSKHELSFDLILVTIPDPFDVTPYVSLLKRDGALVTVGLLGPYKKPISNMEVAMHRRSLTGSLIGGIRETQEVLDFCAQHSILPEVDMIPIQDINNAFERMQQSATAT